MIATARQIQSEYWSLVSDSLFIQITTHLESDVWLDQQSLLAVGTEVTVQCEGDDFGSRQPTKGAFYAKVESAPQCACNIPAQLHVIRVQGVVTTCNYMYLQLQL